MPTLIKKKKKKKKKKKYLSVNSNLPAISSHVSHPDSPSPIFPGHPIKPALSFSASHLQPHLTLHIFLIHENFNQSKEEKRTWWTPTTRKLSSKYPIYSACTIPGTSFDPFSLCLIFILTLSLFFRT